MALGLLSLIYIALESNGLRILCLLVVLLGTRELIMILFQPDDSILIKIIFYLLMVLLFVLAIKFFAMTAVLFAVVALFFFIISLLMADRFNDLESLSRFQAKSILGFFYVGLLPAFACKLIDFQHGQAWFFALLTIVFSGDTLAYITGRLVGRHKLMPKISPKKTIEGAFGGLIGSALAALCFQPFLSHLNWTQLTVLGLVVGFVGQAGDLFESTLKRVAHVKDSGSIMPGHGGILDRVDGVLFASPFMLLAAHLFEQGPRL